MNAKDKIYTALVEKLGIRHPDVYKFAGEWCYTAFGRGERVELGRSLKVSLEYIDQLAEELAEALS